MSARVRYPLLALGLVSLVCGIWAGLSNTDAIGLFLVTTLGSAVLARRARSARRATPATRGTAGDDPL